MDLGSVADELYGLPPEEFIAARTAREKEAKAAGDKELARQIHALGKPNQVAWLANQLARRHGEEVRPLLELGAGLRDAADALTGEQLRDFTKQKRQLVGALVQQGRRLAGESGRTITDETARGLEDTLNAGLSDPEAARALVEGRLTTGLQYSGFGPVVGGLDGVSAGSAERTSTAAPPTSARRTRQTEEERRAERLTAAQAAVAGAEAAADEARQGRDEAQEALGQAEDAAAEGTAAVERLQQELEQALADQVRAEREHRHQQKALERAEHAADGAEGRLQKARQALQRLVDEDGGA